MSWKDETCETCEFRIGYICRRLPPNLKTVEKTHEEGKAVSRYPEIINFEKKRQVDAWFPACAEYKPNQSKRKDG